MTSSVWLALRAVCRMRCPRGVRVVRVVRRLFPAESAAQGSALSATTNWLANFVVGQTFLPLSLALGGYCFLPSAAILAVFVLWALFSVPETRGKSVEQIAAELR